MVHVALDVAGAKPLVGVHVAAMQQPQHRQLLAALEAGRQVDVDGARPAQLARGDLMHLHLAARRARCDRPRAIADEHERVLAALAVGVVVGRGGIVAPTCRRPRTCTTTGRARGPASHARCRSHRAASAACRHPSPSSRQPRTPAGPAARRCRRSPARREPEGRRRPAGPRRTTRSGAWWHDAVAAAHPMPRRRGRACWLARVGAWVSGFTTRQVL